MAISARRLAYLLLEPAARLAQPLPAAVRRGGVLADLGLVLLILLSVVAVILQSTPTTGARYGEAFALLEVVVVAVFTVEYALRVWAAPEHPDYARDPAWRARLRYLLTPMAWVDLIAILPFYLGLFGYADGGALLVARVLRLFKLAHYFPPMRLLLHVLENEAKAIGAALFTLLVLLVLAASLAYWAEREAQPDAFGSIPQAMWWGVVTLTTVGYGDVTPVTTLGRVVSGAIMILGVGMVALPAGLLAAGFADELHRRRRRFEDAAARRLADGRFSPEERAELVALADRLGLSDEQIVELTRLAARSRPHGSEPRFCPHCGASLEPWRTPDRPAAGRGAAE